MRLSLAQYRELAAFAQFASDLDEATRKQLERGRMVTELMKQPQYEPLQVCEMALTLFAVNNSYFDDIDVKKALAAEKAMLAFIKDKYTALVERIESTKDCPRKTKPRCTRRSRTSSRTERTNELNTPSPRLEDFLLSQAGDGRGEGRQQKGTGNGRFQGNQDQDQERAKHAQDHQGDGNGRGLQNAQGAGAQRAARPYAEKIRNVAAHLSHANPEYRHPYLVARDTVKKVGIIVVTADKGLCGGLNTNVLRMALSKMREWESQGESFEVCCIGNKGLGFMQRLGANVVSHVVGLGDKPHMERLIGALKIMLDGYAEDRFDRLEIFYTKFINTMKQEPVMEQLLPLTGERLGAPEGSWDYIYEPDAKSVLDQTLTRYIEALIYQSVTENMASEQSARMVAMKAASDNAGSVIDELTLIYNKSRQAAITKELSEIVAGAAAV